MVTATDASGMPASRPMVTLQFDDDRRLWFFARSDGSVARDIEKNPRASASYSVPSHGLYVTLSGYARLVYDPERMHALWNDPFVAWFGQGLRDPRLALLRVDVERARWWDQGSRRLLKALVRAQGTLPNALVPAPAAGRRLALRGESVTPMP